MANLTPEERETCILVDDQGHITVWSLSPTWQRRLARTLGKPTRKDTECHYWDGLTTKQANISARKKRKATPAQLESLRELRKPISAPSQKTNTHPGTDDTDQEEIGA